MGHSHCIGAFVLVYAASSRSHLASGISIDSFPLSIVRIHHSMSMAVHSRSVFHSTPCQSILPSSHSIPIPFPMASFECPNPLWCHSAAFSRKAPRGRASSSLITSGRLWPIFSLIHVSLSLSHFGFMNVVGLSRKIFLPLSVVSRFLPPACHLPPSHLVT